MNLRAVLAQPRRDGLAQARINDARVALVSKKPDGHIRRSGYGQLSQATRNDRVHGPGHIGPTARRGYRDAGEVARASVAPWVAAPATDRGRCRR